MHNRLWKGQVFKCECRWNRCSELGGCLLSLSLHSSSFLDLLRLKPPTLFLMSSSSLDVGVTSLDWINLTRNRVKKNVKWSPYRTEIVQRVGRGIALLVHDRGTRMG